MIEADFAETGFVRREGVIDPGVALEAHDWVVRQRELSNVPSTRDLIDRDLPGPIKLRRLWNADPDFWSDILERCGVLDVLPHYLDDPIMLIRSAAFIKYPGGRSTVGWHCDEDLWAHPSQKGLTAWIPLTRVSEESGCLQFLPGSHRAAPGALYWDLSHPYHKVMNVSDLGTPRSLPAEVGDCILMDKRCVHASGPNQSTGERIGLVLAFANCEQSVLNESAVAWRNGRWLEMESTH